jgi:hypothetical protein
MRVPKEYVMVAKYMLISAALFVVLYFGGRGIAGLVIYGPDSESSISVEQSFAEDEELFFALPELGVLKALSIEGEFSGNGRALVYLELENRSLLVLDTQNPKEVEAEPIPNVTRAPLITGRVIDEGADSGSEPGEAEATGGESEGVSAAESPGDEGAEASPSAEAQTSSEESTNEPAETGEPDGGPTPEQEGGESTQEEPSRETQEDTIDDADEEAEAAQGDEENAEGEEEQEVEEGAEDQEGEGAEQEPSGEEEGQQESPVNETAEGDDEGPAINGTSPGEGNQSGSEPVQGNHTAELPGEGNQTGTLPIEGNQTQGNASQGNQNATLPVEGNQTAAQNQTSSTVVPEGPGQPVEPGEGGIIPGIAPLNFQNVCDETCSLFLNASGIKLQVKIEGEGVLRIQRLHYLLSKITRLIQPELKKQIPNIIIEENHTATLILSDYFDGNNLSFVHSMLKDIETEISAGRIRFIPRSGFVGSEKLKLYASNEKGVAESNEFRVQVKDFEKEELLNRLKAIFPYLAFIEVAQADRLYTVVYEINNTVVRISGLENVSLLKDISVGTLDEIII